MNDRTKESIRRYQQTEKYKQYKKNSYLDKVKDEYRNKTAEFLHTFHKKSGKMVNNEIDIFNMIDDCKESKEVKKVYDDLIHLIKVSK